VAIPLAVCLRVLFALYYFLARQFGRLDATLLCATAAILSVAVAAARFGMAMPWCLIVLIFAPAVSVVGFALVGDQREADPRKH
jgi:hypothetical protein